jgi:SAM-dependent methyltransferase
MPDKSNGYEEYAAEFTRRRDTWIGPIAVRDWAASLPSGAEILELGCGHGVVTQVLVDAGFKLSVVDASPSLLRAFIERFPTIPTECSAAEDSSFFGRSFDGVVAWGLLFLLEEGAQRAILRKVGSALRPGGRFLFTSPREPVDWIDVMTRKPSRSLGAPAYEQTLREAGMDVSHGVTDEGGNYYYFASKPNSQRQSSRSRYNSFDP